jgi:uncharacterized protein GlcG (DUF336 family)
MRGLRLDEALAIITGAFAEAAKLNCHPLSVVVLDAGGRVKAFQKQDGCSLLRFEIAYGKAFAALSLNRSSRSVLAKAREKPLFMQSMEALSDGPLFLEGGGQLIRDASGEIVGSVGATGDVNEMDDICAIAGIRAAGFRSDADFSADEAQILNIKIDPPLKDPRKAQERGQAKSAQLAGNKRGKDRRTGNGGTPNYPDNNRRVGPRRRSPA